MNGKLLSNQIATHMLGASPLGGGEGTRRAPVPPIILQLQGGLVFSGKIYFTNSAYSLSIVLL